MNLRTVWVPLWYPKNLCCKIWNQSLQTPYLTCKYKILAKSYYILKFDVFAWFQSIKKHSHFKFVKTQAKHQTSKYCKILPRFYTYMWDMAFEGFDFKFCNTNFLGTTMVPILSLNSSNSSQFFNKNIYQQSAQMWRHSQTWYPAW